jgi:hypothetical protein
MKTITLERDNLFRSLVRSTSRRADPETASLAEAIADGTRALDMASLEQLTRRILDTGDGVLLDRLVAYCISHSIMFDVEMIRAKGWRKLLVRLKRRPFRRW